MNYLMEWKLLEIKDNEKLNTIINNTLITKKI